MTHPSDGCQLDKNNQDRHRRRDVKVMHQIRQRVADATERRHGSRDEAANPGSTSASEAAVVGQRLGKTHAYASPERCGEADRKGVPGVLGSKRRREDGCERRNRTVHQSGQSWLYDLQDEEASFSLVLFFANLGPELGFLQLSS